MLKHFLFILLLGITSTVRSDPVMYELPDEEKQQLLDAHNGYRSDAVRRFGASNMGALVNLNDCDRSISFNRDILQEWSETLATMASYRAMQCHLANEEDGLTTQEYTSIGQNLAKTLIFSGTKVVHGYINFTQIVGYWYSQHTYYSVTDNACTTSCNQFLQVIGLLVACVMIINSYSWHRWYGLIPLLLAVVRAYVMIFTHMHFSYVATMDPRKDLLILIKGTFPNCLLLGLPP